MICTFKFLLYLYFRRSRGQYVSQSSLSHEMFPHVNGMALNGPPGYNYLSYLRGLILCWGAEGRCLLDAGQYEEPHVMLDYAMLCYARLNC